MPSRGKKLTLLAATVAVVVIGVGTWLAWPHLKFWWLFEPLGKNEQGYFEYRHRQTGIVMVKVPGGTFWMGAQKEDPSGRNYDPDAERHEGPVHEVTLSPFLIAKFEVTQAEWKRVMGSNPSHFNGDNLPVEHVSWDDCQTFCQKARLKLPTEAQWEYSCRAGTSGPFAGTGKLDDMGWYGDNSNDTTHRVGQKQPNQFGLHDTHGNVWEPCEDVYNDGVVVLKRPDGVNEIHFEPDAVFYGSPEACRKNPLCTCTSGHWSHWTRVFRGGGWNAVASVCRSAGRSDAPSDSQFLVSDISLNLTLQSIGFRAAFYPLP